jgi:hypothetical protein
MKVWVEVGKSAEGSAEILEEIQQQNVLLRELLIFQEQSSIATALLLSWARPMTNYLGQIAHALEARNEAGGSGGSGSGWVEEKGKEKETEREQDKDAENRNGNGDKDGDEDGDGDSDRDADGEETMGKSL